MGSGLSDFDACEDLLQSALVSRTPGILVLSFASGVSFAAATALMREMLLVAPTTNPESVRQHTYRVARRIETELGE